MRAPLPPGPVAPGAPPPPLLPRPLDPRPATPSALRSLSSRPRLLAPRLPDALRPPGALRPPAALRPPDALRLPLAASRPPPAPPRPPVAPRPPAAGPPDPRPAPPRPEELLLRPAPARLLPRLEPRPDPPVGRPSADPRELPAICPSSNTGLAAAPTGRLGGRTSLLRQHKNALRATTRKVTALSGKMSGGVLLSHPVPRAVPSALKGLTSGFGMEPGVSPSPWPPKHYGDVQERCGPDLPRFQGHPWASRVGTRRPTASREPHSGRETRSISRSQATRPISTGQLRALPRFHLRPINPVV